MKLYLEIDIRPYLRMWKSNDNGTSNKKVMKKFYELFAQPSYFIWVTRGLYSSMITMFTSVYDKETVTSRMTLGMSIYSLKMLWRDCTNYNSVWVIIFHDNQISHLAFLYVSWLNDTYSNQNARDWENLSSDL